MAAWYSILGLSAIFAAAVVPIIIMGSFLELAKVVVTVWLHEYWHRCRLAMKIYLVPAVAMLMMITSMGIFGFLSKAHSDQSLVSGDSQAKLAIYDEKIKTSRGNIEANRKALQQMDAAVDQIMGRSSDEKGADKAVATRRSQQKERARLLAEITAEQKTIANLNQEAAPLRAENRKIEAEVGPIKYIAALIYGDNPDQNLLERAVRWVIIMLVVVFDPLAIMMVLASTESLKWHRDDYAMAIAEATKQSVVPNVADTPESETPLPEPVEPSYLKNWKGFDNLEPQVANYEPDDGPLTQEQLEQVQQSANQAESISEQVVASNEENDDDDEPQDVKEAKSRWKQDNPNDTLKNQRQLLAQGKITELPWMGLVADNDPPSHGDTGFGIDFPDGPKKGDMFVRVDVMPNRLYKYNGDDWIFVDKSLTDSYTYNTAYIDHLISKISSGEYDVDLLSDSEREQVTERLEQKKQT